MKKRFFALLTAVLVCLCFAFNVGASSSVLRDGAGLLTDGQYGTLLSRLEEIGQKYGIPVAVVTEDDLDGYNIESFAKRFYDDIIGDGDGVIMLISLDDDYRGVHIYSHGRGYDAMCNCMDDLSESVAAYCTKEDYAGGIQHFADECEKHIDIEINGAPFGIVKHILIALAVGLVVALVVTAVMRGKLKSVRPQNAAEQYVVAGSMKVTDSRELFLYKNVVRTHIPKSNPPSGGGRSGGSRSGGSTARF